MGSLDCGIHASLNLGEMLNYFQDGHAILYAKQQFMGVPVISPFGWHLIAFFSFVLAILIGVQCLLIVVLIYISLMINNSEHFSHVFMPIICFLW